MFNSILKFLKRIIYPKSVVTVQTIRPQVKITVTKVVDGYKPKRKKKSKDDRPNDHLCPHCQYDFIDTPTRSRKCPSCKRQIMRTKRPNSDRLELVTQVEYEKIEKEFQKIHLEEVKKKFKLALKAEFEHLSNKNYGLYQNAIRDQFDYYQEIGDSEKALQLKSKYLYCDLNGAHNNGHFLKINYINEYTFKEAIEQMHALGLNKVQLKIFFIESTFDLHELINAPKSPEELWNKYFEPLMLDNLE